VRPSGQWQCRLAQRPNWLPWAAMSKRARWVAVPTGRVRKCCRAVDAASPRLVSRAPSRPRHLPCPKPTTSPSKRRAPARVHHRRCPTASTVAKPSTVSGARALPPLPLFLRGLLSRASSPPPPRRRTAAGH
jgi:hypothetical protein